jgi:hypothetical protein
LETSKAAWLTALLSAGVLWKEWTSAPGGTNAVTSTRSPPTFFTKSANSAVVVTTGMGIPSDGWADDWVDEDEPQADTANKTSNAAGIAKNVFDRRDFLRVDSR